MVKQSRKEAGVLMVELMVAIAILTLAMLPLAFTFLHESTLTRNAYQRAVAMEVIDGEMEILMAGEWRTAHAGTQPYVLPEASVKILPPGKASLTITEKHVRLDWVPERKHDGGEVVREAEAP